MKCFTSDHLKWLVNTGKKLKTADGKDVEVWELRHQNDDVVLSAWARHFRNHYCLDDEIESKRGKQSRTDFLNAYKFPSKTVKPGPSIRAGDFGEILVADFLQWMLKFWVPRIRWRDKAIRNESTKGCDVIGFRYFKEGKVSNKDVLAVFEAKANFSIGSKSNRLQDAINGSAKDPTRLGESLNYIRQKLDNNQAKLVERFQNPVDIPYQETYGAAALITEDQFREPEICSADTSKIPMSAKSTEFAPHPNRDMLVLLVIKGADMMSLVHELYRRAADEA